jgi:hypothetical protein
MILFRTFVSLLLLMWGVPAVAAPPLPDLYVMRHLEYRGEGSHARLSEIGANHAQRLAAAFGNLPPPVAIYTATEQVSLDSSAWLAIRLGVYPKLFDPKDIDALVAKLAQERGPVLVVASRDDAATIIARVSGGPAPQIAENAFGEVWLISGRDRSVTRRRLYDTTAGQGEKQAPIAPWQDDGEIADRNRTGERPK